MVNRKAFPGTARCWNVAFSPEVLASVFFRSKLSSDKYGNNQKHQFGKFSTRRRQDERTTTTERSRLLRWDYSIKSLSVSVQRCLFWLHFPCPILYARILIAFLRPLWRSQGMVTFYFRFFGENIYVCSKRSVGFGMGTMLVRFLQHTCLLFYT